MKARDIPNLLTVGRILLVLPILWALYLRRFDVALVLFFLAGASDGLDGLLAKRFGWTSRLGELLDPVADKTLLVSCYLMLAWLALLPLWLVALVLLRDLVIVVGAALYHWRIAPLEAAPTYVSKLNTLLQILLVLLVITAEAAGWPPRQWLQILIYAVSVSTLWSGTDYVITWGRRARERAGQRAQ